MSFKQPYTVGLRSVGAYQVSGRPWVEGGINASASTKAIAFPFVARWVVISNTGTLAAKVSFSAAAEDDGNYLEIPGGTTSPRLEVKCTGVWLDGGDNAAVLSICAGLTNIPKDQMYTLSGLDGIDAE
jgi:hypothetical protein